ncbi:MAG: hypothetical protein LC649_11305 [Bacteroidales bacterium]|nr:hypothetical protein [Bacteroidales bacterium]
MKTLVIVDPQNDFMPGGALAVPDGDMIVPVINSIVGSFDLVVATQDWHPRGHRSFASGQQWYKGGAYRYRGKDSAEQLSDLKAIETGSLKIMTCRVYRGRS